MTGRNDQIAAQSTVKEGFTVRQSLPNDVIIPPNCAGFLQARGQHVEAMYRECVGQSRPENMAPVTTIPATIATANVIADGPFNAGVACLR